MNGMISRITAAAFLATLVLSGAPGQAEDRAQEHRPYGGYCRGPRWGWYGERTPVRTAADARKRLAAFFDGKDFTIGAVTDRGMHFIAELKDPSGRVVDRILVCKRTGRIRSLY